MQGPFEARLALIPVLAEKSPGGKIGRTALMKYMYLLQTLRDIPLGYRFTLYSYGPFDAEVLADLGNAQTLNAVESQPVFYPGGYGYRITPGANAEWLYKTAEKFLVKYESDVEWVTDKFGSLTSSQLELVSTVIYVDREAAQRREKLKLTDLANRVHEIKPHFDETQILSFAEGLAKDRLLKATH